MAEVLSEFPHVLVDEAGTRYHAHACGAALPDGHWEGWLEFLPLDGSAPIRSARETTQPDRKAAIYWAGGLTPVYLDGALSRALKPRLVKVRYRDEPAFAAPASTEPAPPRSAPPAQDAVLDPFAVYRNGEALLRTQLGALSAWHLVNIVEAFRLTDAPPAMLDRLPHSALVDLIVSAVAQRPVRDAG
jgi:hypothetical protein